MYAIDSPSLFLLPNKCNRKKKKCAIIKVWWSVSGCWVMVRYPDNLDSEPPISCLNRTVNRKRSAAVY